jgi:adenine-specific DNA glycosylase
VLVREVVFNGRAGDTRIDKFLTAYPDAASASRRRPSTVHERRAHGIARQLLKAGSHLPEDVNAVESLAGTSTGVARLIVALVHGGEAPRSGGTVRVAERVSGVRRTGSLTGISHVVLSRLAEFGDNVAVNQLLVDLARTICVADTPRCGSCPLRETCAYAAGRRPNEADEVPEPLTLC